MFTLMGLVYALDTVGYMSCIKIWPSEDVVEEFWFPLLEPAVPVCWISPIILFVWRNLQFGLDVSAEVRRHCCKLRTGSGVKVRWGLMGFENWQ